MRQSARSPCTTSGPSVPPRFRPAYREVCELGTFHLLNVPPGKNVSSHRCLDGASSRPNDDEAGVSHPAGFITMPRTAASAAPRRRLHQLYCLDEQRHSLQKVFTCFRVMPRCSLRHREASLERPEASCGLAPIPPRPSHSYTANAKKPTAITASTPATSSGVRITRASLGRRPPTSRSPRF